MPTLICTHPEKNKRWLLEFQREVVHIGRSRTAEICISDVDVSKNHVCIELQGGRYRFRDLGSTNGTFINDLKSDGGPLYDGDELRVGKVLIAFYRDKAPPSLQEDPANEDPTEKDSMVTFSEALMGDGAGDGDPVGAAGAGREVDEEILLEETLKAIADTAPGNMKAERARSHPRVRQPRQPAPSGPERILVWILVGAGLLALGFWLGRATARGFGESPLAIEGPGASPPAAGGIRGLERALRTTRSRESSAGGKIDRPEPANSPVAVSAEKDESSHSLILGARADLSDPQTSRRALYRLSIDLTGRTPTRAEFAKLLPLSHEERWEELTRMASSDENAPVLDAIPDFFEALMGRPSRPAEYNELVVAASGDANRLGQIVASGRFYAGEHHRRRRSPKQRARSLWVDVLDRLPTPENTRTLVQALEETPLETLRMVVYSKWANIGPGNLGMDDRTWLLETYMRFVQRHPTTEEERRAVEEMRRQKDGWQLVVFSLTQRSGYLQY